MILKKNRNLVIYDEADVNGTTLYKYFPQIDRTNIKNITQKVLDNGLKIYVIILTQFIQGIKLEIRNANDPYECVQFNAIVNINAMKYKNNDFNNNNSNSNSNSNSNTSNNQRKQFARLINNRAVNRSRLSCPIDYDNLGNNIYTPFKIYKSR